jgi:hypothetical protein
MAGLKESNTESSKVKTSLCILHFHCHYFTNSAEHQEKNVNLSRKAKEEMEAEKGHRPTP